jgi:hypothetical protein
MRRLGGKIESPVEVVLAGLSCVLPTPFQALAFLGFAENQSGSPKTVS